MICTIDSELTVNPSCSAIDCTISRTVIYSELFSYVGLGRQHIWAVDTWFLDFSTTLSFFEYFDRGFQVFLHNSLSQIYQSLNSSSFHSAPMSLLGYLHPSLALLFQWCLQRVSLMLCPFVLLLSLSVFSLTLSFCDSCFSCSSYHLLPYSW